VDGAEIDARIPAEEYIDVCRYILQLRLGEHGFFFCAGANRSEQKRFQQLRDAGEVHGKDCRLSVENP